jgi:hypothetical protein
MLRIKKKYTETTDKEDLVKFKRERESQGKGVQAHDVGEDGHHAPTVHIPRARFAARILMEVIGMLSRPGKDVLQHSPQALHDRRLPQPKEL